MPFTAPPLKGTGDPIGAAGWNTYVRDNLNYLYTQTVQKHGCLLRRSFAASYPTATQSFIQWNSEIEDSDGYHDTLSNPSRIYIPAGLGGIYAVEFFFQHSTGTASQIGVNKNSIAQTRKSMAGVLDSIFWLGPASDGDYIEGWFFNGGATGNETVVTTPDNLNPYTPHFSCYKVG